MLVIIGTGISLSVFINSDYKLSAQWSLGLLIALVVFFSIANFRVIKGSLLAAKILKYYAVILATIRFPALMLQNTNAAIIFCAINILILLAAIYLLSGSKYWMFVQYQRDFFTDINQTKARKLELILSLKKILLRRDIFYNLVSYMTSELYSE